MSGTYAKKEANEVEGKTIKWINSGRREAKGKVGEWKIKTKIICIEIKSIKWIEGCDILNIKQYETE